MYLLEYHRAWTPCMRVKQEKKERCRRKTVFAFCMVLERTEGEGFKNCTVFVKGRREQKDPIRRKFVMMFHDLLIREAETVSLFMNQTVMNPLYCWFLNNTNHSVVISAILARPDQVLEQSSFQ